MTTPATPQVDCERYHAGLPVDDVLAAVDFYTHKLGFKPGFTWGEPVRMAGVNLGGVQIFLSHAPPNPQGVSLFFVVGNADELCEFHRANGVEIIEPPDDRLYGLRDYKIRDLHGYQLTFGHYIYTTGPPLEITRVAVPVRLEQRLAALLTDLAEHKHMSINSCLEEILLHTCEPFGDGVASPHTTSTLRHIQELKKKHGIDYDCHASYRFVESGP
jgi:catechol 2,3-dioxygenase-like lactoylglutathione lyase family enzyme